MRDGYKFDIGSGGFTFHTETGPADGDLWWRAEDRRYANYDPWAEYEQPSGSHLAIEMRPYRFVRATPKGVWLADFFGGEHFVLGTATRQLAVPTKALALQDLVARKKRHVWGAEARAARARQHLAAAEHMLSLAVEAGQPTAPSGSGAGGAE